jgi:hypothetical protein
LESEHIYTPVEAYNTQIEEMNNEIKRLEETKPEAKNKVEKDIEKIKKSIEILRQEQSSQIKEKEKFDGFFQLKKTPILLNFFTTERNIPFIQHCLLPRLRLSHSDSIYCAKFMHYVFNLQNYDPRDQLEFKFAVIKTIFPTIQCCSENEAFSLGVFLREILAFSENIFDSSKNFSVNLILRQEAISGKKSVKTNTADDNKIKLVMLVMFKKLAEMLDNFIRDSTYMQVRNIIVVLNRILPVYPNTREFANIIFESIKKRIPEKEKNEKKSSLDVLAQSYKTSLSSKKLALPDIDINGIALVNLRAAGPVQEGEGQEEPEAKRHKGRTRVGDVEQARRQEEGREQGQEGEGESHRKDSAAGAERCKLQKGGEEGRKGVRGAETRWRPRQQVRQPRQPEVREQKRQETRQFVKEPKTRR